MKRLFDAVLVVVLALSIAVPAAFAGPRQTQTQSQHPQTAPTDPTQQPQSPQAQPAPRRISPNSHKRRTGRSRLRLTKIKRRRASNPVRRKTLIPSGTGCGKGRKPLFPGARNRARKGRRARSGTVRQDGHRPGGHGIRESRRPESVRNSDAKVPFTIK